MESTECVRVAVNIRPLITPELLNGCTDCITVAPKEPQVHIGSHTFTYDFVYGNGGYPCSEIYNHCVAPLVDALFKGYNATVLAYGQTGSGKTYTMGTNYSGDCTNGGVIPNVMEDIFRRVETTKDSSYHLLLFNSLDFSEIVSCCNGGFDFVTSRRKKTKIRKMTTSQVETGFFVELNKGHVFITRRDLASLLLQSRNGWRLA